ncbi:MAG: DNA-directed RNA polymerase, partial [Terriglobales bacterium]
PEIPLRVAEAVDKVQGTAWRINRAALALALLDTPDGRLFEPSLEKEMTLAEAQELSSLERFYFAVFLDFRGRVNQRGGQLSYTGSGDYARGLLEFADGEFVDSNGEKWLAWHMAQMWGRDLPYMPLGDGSVWAAGARDLRWQDADHPAQFLAARLAWLDAIEGKPVHLPVRLDASCSGLQHLALLARDAELARTVNLWGDYHGDRRSLAWLELPPKPDFYDIVAAQCTRSRKEVKEVLVPLLYGAGEETSGLGLAGALGTPLDERVQTLANAIRDKACELAPHAFAILDWFGRVAEAHNDVNCPVRWTAPSGFGGVQDYRYVERNPRRADRQAKIMVNGRRVDLVKRFYTELLDKPQQVISMPSSIVHSLDAALLAEIVAGSGIDQWGVVHDAFAVPANYAWDLLQANEAAMGVLYKPDRLAEWTEAWRDSGVDVPDPPPHEPKLPREMLGALRTLG